MTTHLKVRRPPSSSEWSWAVRVRSAPASISCAGYFSMATLLLSPLISSWKYLSFQWCDRLIQLCGQVQETQTLMTLLPLENVLWISSHLLTNEVICLFAQQSPPGVWEERRWCWEPRRAELMHFVCALTGGREAGISWRQQQIMRGGLASLSAKWAVWATQNESFCFFCSFHSFNSKFWENIWMLRFIIWFTRYIKPAEQLG